MSRPINRRDIEYFFSHAEELTAEFVERTLEEGRDELRRQFAASLRRKLTTLYAGRFGFCPDAVSDVLNATKNPDLLSDWLPLFATRSKEEIAHELRAWST